MGVELVTRAALRARLQAALFVVAVLSSAAPTRAAVTLTASRAEALYSADPDPDCSKLSKLPDGQLPLNVIRLHATVAGGAPADARYHWSVPPKQVGMLIADLDLGPGQQTGAIQALCAEFGNACTLTVDKLPFYNQPTVLWVAPTCDVLSSKTDRRNEGGAIRVAVTVTQGRHRLGKATTKPPLGFGRVALVTLSADGRDGVGMSSVPVSINPSFEAVVATPGIMLPAGGVFEFANGGGGFEVSSSCSDRRYAACAPDMLYQHAGKFLATVKERFDDGSALCDNMTTNVLTANIIPKLTVSATPKGTYLPGDPVRGNVHLKVTLRNASPRQGGSAIVLIGSNVLVCASELHLAGTTDNVQTVFDTRHCSATKGHACESDRGCQPLSCGECTLNETCLTESHCSQTLTKLCFGDTDCQKPTCADCQESEVCVHVLNQPAPIVLGIGRQIDLIDTIVPVRNLFPDVAHVLDTWTVNTFNAGSADAKLRYRIRPSPSGP